MEAHESFAKFAHKFPHNMAILNGILLPELQQAGRALLLDPFAMNTCNGIFVRHLWSGCLLAQLRNRLAADNIVAAFLAGELDGLLRFNISHLPKIQRRARAGRMNLPLRDRDAVVGMLLSVGTLSRVLAADAASSASSADTLDCASA